MVERARPPLRKRRAEKTAEPLASSGTLPLSAVAEPVAAPGRDGEDSQSRREEQAVWLGKMGVQDRGEVRIGKFDPQSRAPKGRTKERFLTPFTCSFTFDQEGAAATGAGQASTGRTAPANLNEQLAMQQAKSNPAAGQRVPITMNDPRWPASQGWVKMQQNVNGVTIHYDLNTVTGETADWKFK